jgi:hypothetical protein
MRLGERSGNGSRAARTAAVLTWVPGLGFGLPGVYAIRYFAERHQPWVFMGFPTYGDGPFEAVGIDTSVPLLGLFLAVCLVELVLGAALWRGARLSVAAGLALLPLEFAFWIGFALPFGYLFGAARAAVLLVALRQDRVRTAGT